MRESWIMNTHYIYTYVYICIHTTQSVGDVFILQSWEIPTNGTILSFFPLPAVPRGAVPRSPRTSLPA